MTGFFTTIKKLRPVYDASYKVLMTLCKLLLIGDIAITLWAVAGRYIPFIKDPSWSEEIVLTLMVYLTVLSAALALRKGAHIRMTAFDRSLSPKMLTLTDILSDLLVMELGAVMLATGIKLLDSPLCRLGKYSSLPKLSKFWQYIPVAIAGGSMILFELEQLFQHLEKLLLTDENSTETAPEQRKEEA